MRFCAVKRTVNAKGKKRDRQPCRQVDTIHNNMVMADKSPNNMVMADKSPNNMVMAGKSPNKMAMAGCAKRKKERALPGQGPGRGLRKRSGWVSHQQSFVVVATQLTHQQACAHYYEILQSAPHPDPPGPCSSWCAVHTPPR